MQHIFICICRFEFHHDIFQCKFFTAYRRNQFYCGTRLRNSRNHKVCHIAACFKVRCLVSDHFPVVSAICERSGIVAVLPVTVGSGGRSDSLVKNDIAERSIFSHNDFVRIHIHFLESESDCLRLKFRTVHRADRVSLVCIFIYSFIKSSERPLVSVTVQRSDGIPVSACFARYRHRIGVTHIHNVFRFQSALV